MKLLFEAWKNSRTVWFKIVSMHAISGKIDFKTSNLLKLTCDVDFNINVCDPFFFSEKP